MAKQAKTLTAQEIAKLVKPGRYSVGTVAGLALFVKDTGAASWVLRTMVAGSRRDIGLGGYPAVPLKSAHQRARDALSDIRAGVDPVLKRKATSDALPWTFERCAIGYIDSHRAGWKNAKHAQQWTSSLATYAFPVIGSKHIADVGRSDVLKVIEPIWCTKNETASRVRNRIERVIDWAVARDLRPDGKNPAAWKGNLDQALPAASSVSPVKPQPAVAIDEVQAAYATIQAKEGIAPLCLQFLILTAARSEQARGATWAEIDTQNAVWSIPAARMKSARAHRVPLSREALELLERLPRFAGTDLLFPGVTVSKPLVAETLGKLLKECGILEAPDPHDPAKQRRHAVPHGFRSTFADWARERTHHDANLALVAIAHRVLNDSDGAYMRGDLFEKRRALMDGWAAFVTGAQEQASGNVIQLPVRAA